MDKESEGKEDSTTCIYHHRKWSSKIQFLANQLRGKIIPPNLIKRLRIICTCTEENADLYKDHKEKSFKRLKNLIDSAVDTKPSIWHPENKGLQETAGDVLQEIMSTPQQEIRHGRWRLLVVLDRCMDGDFSILKKPKKRSSPSQLPARASEKIWKNKYNYERTFDSKLSGCYAGCLFGAQGQHIKTICKNNSCEIRLRDPVSELRMRSLPVRGGFRRRGARTNRISTVGERAVCIDIRGNDEHDIENAKEEILSSILSVTMKREKHLENVKLFAKKRQRHLQRVRENRIARAQYKAEHNPYNLLNAAKFKKEMAEDKFVKRRTAHNKKKDILIKKRRETQLLGNFHSLIGGHCKHCHMPFSSASEMHKTKCRFHPGYLVLTAAAKQDYVLNSEQDMKASDESFDDSVNSPDSEEMTDLTESILQVDISHKTTPHYKNHKNHHKPSSDKSKKSGVKDRIDDDPAEKSKPLSRLKKLRKDEKKAMLNGLKRSRTDSHSTEDSYVTCNEGWVGKSAEQNIDCHAGKDNVEEIDSCGRDNGSSSPIESSSYSMSDNGDEVHDNAAFLHGKRNVQKWSCCNIVLLDVPKSCDIGKIHYNHLHTGCEYGMHEFVKAVNKRDDNVRKAYRKSRAAGRDSVSHDDFDFDQTNCSVETV